MLPIRSIVVFLSIFASCVIVASSCSGVDCKDPANAASASCTAQRVLEDCTASTWTDAILKYGPQVADIIHGAKHNPDGSVDWSSIDGPLVTAVGTFGQCVVADVFGKIIFSKSVVVGSGASTITPAAARQAFEDLRAKHFPTKSFKTAGGTL
jgi:hypothetical protein